VCNRFATFANMITKVKVWVEAMRLRTLPVSVAGVLFAWGLTLLADRHLQPAPAILCLAFAILAQIASNFANEYFDFRAGLDRVGRDGPRRGVTEGDITPRAMLVATFVTLGVACCIGLATLFYGPWWLLIAGVVIALGALAYSAGPYPLSHHGWGDVAVVLFFGVIPVWLTTLLQHSSSVEYSWILGIAVGMMADNVLMVNNYRDADDDSAVGKLTIAVRFGREVVSGLYLLSGWLAMVIIMPVIVIGLPNWALIVPAVYLILHTKIWTMLCHRSGTALNPLLGMTSVTMLIFCVAFLIISAIV
jgi:1,4-dihydroxy-2-naphthoate octaprenyltransferase